MRGAIPLPARAESPADRLSALLAESASALSQAPFDANSLTPVSSMLVFVSGRYIRTW